jgi:hypothetical protein
MTSGLTYYVHDNGLTQWEKPQCMVERDKAVAAAALLATANAKAAAERERAAAAAAAAAASSTSSSPATAVGAVSPTRSHVRTLSVTERENMASKAPGMKAKPTLPIGWVEFTDKATQKKYFYNKLTKATTWERPVA